MAPTPTTVRPPRPSKIPAPGRSLLPPASEATRRGYLPTAASQAALVAMLLLLVFVLVSIAIILVGEHIERGPGAVLARLHALTAYEIAAALVPTFLGTIAAYLYTRRTMQARVEPIAEAMNRILAGDFETEPVPVPEREFEKVEDSMRAVRSVIAEAYARLTHQDSQRRRFFADLSHDLSSPVSTLLSILDTLGTEGLVTERREQVRLFCLLEHEVDVLSHLVGDIRDLAYLEDPEVRFEKVDADIADIVRDATDAFAMTKGARIEIDAESILAPVDAMRLEQVIRNLVQNARRHTPESGAIRVSVRTESHSARITVEDDGPGVSDATLEKLGERFFREDSVRERTDRGAHGLGLSIVAAIVERHDGVLAFGHASSGGLRVVIDIPRFDTPRGE